MQGIHDNKPRWNSVVDGSRSSVWEGNMTRQCIYHSHSLQAHTLQDDMWGFLKGCCQLQSAALLATKRPHSLITLSWDCPEVTVGQPSFMFVLGGPVLSQSQVCGQFSGYASDNSIFFSSQQLWVVLLTGRQVYAQLLLQHKAYSL